MDENRSVERIAIALERIAAALDGLLESTNPINQYTVDDIDMTKQRVLYTDEEKDMVQAHLRRMGKEYKQRV